MGGGSKLSYAYWVVLNSLKHSEFSSSFFCYTKPMKNFLFWRFRILLQLSQSLDYVSDKLMLICTFVFVLHASRVIIIKNVSPDHNLHSRRKHHLFVASLQLISMDRPVKKYLGRVCIWPIKVTIACTIVAFSSTLTNPNETLEWFFFKFIIFFYCILIRAHKTNSCLTSTHFNFSR